MTEAEFEKVQVVIFIMDDNTYYIPYCQTTCADYSKIFDALYSCYEDSVPFEALVFDKKGIDEVRKFFRQFSIPYAEISLKDVQVTTYK